MNLKEMLVFFSLALIISISVTPLTYSEEVLHNINKFKNSKVVQNDDVVQNSNFVQKDSSLQETGGLQKMGNVQKIDNIQKNSGKKNKLIDNLLVGEIVYIVSDIRIPFWNTMKKGIESEADFKGYNVSVYSAENSRKKELSFVVKALRDRVDGIIISPTSSSACTTVLKLADKAGIPVVISDIGTDSGEYVSYISSGNFQGAYNLGKILGKKMLSLGWENGTVGIVAIPQKRLNGQLRTAGFMKAMDEFGIKGTGIKQQSSWTEEETYTFCMEFIRNKNDLRAIWLQGSDRYKGALRAIEDTGNSGEILLLTFDAEPEFIDMIKNEVILASAMQQPYLMGKEAVCALDRHLSGEKVTEKIEIPVMAISKGNIVKKLSIIKQNVLGMGDMY